MEFLFDGGDGLYDGCQAILRKWMEQLAAKEMKTDHDQKGMTDMLNLLDGYIQNSLPEQGDFSTNPNLCKKVDNSGHFLPFYGNTVVFLLDDGTRNRLRQLQNALYDSAGEVLSDKLDAAAFHMTLHDLENGPFLTSALQNRMLAARQFCKPLLDRWQGLPPLRMKTTWLFNMVNTSIVLGLAPADGESWQRLDELYLALEEAVPLGYGMTPHITIAYFRPGILHPQQLLQLKKALKPVEWDVTLEMEKLVYQEFTGMNQYWNG